VKKDTTKKSTDLLLRLQREHITGKISSVSFQKNGRESLERTTTKELCFVQLSLHLVAFVCPFMIDREVQYRVWFTWSIYNKRNFFSSH